MVTNAAFKKLALSFSESEELPHFENISFRVKKKIFVTLSEKDRRACLKLPLIEQSVFSSFDPSVIYPVPNKWGKQGWTFAELKTIQKEMLMDALKVAYCTVAPKKLSEKYRTQ
ncbi:MAG: MmcQ/YjbR family DNA-binding protein [Cytophagales bacterium]|nr:MmcQ/YjbR family DNA-binding protein [Cytophaga sp.]